MPNVAKNWISRVHSLADRMAEQGLNEADVSAIAAGLDDVPEGLAVLLNSLELAVAADDRQPITDARIEVDAHLRPHLKALSKALDSYDRLSRRARKRDRAKLV